AGAHAFGGTHRAEARLGPLTCRHIASTATPEISGHYHPKARLGGTARPCFLIDAQRIIMPAYGAYTGGLYCNDEALVTLMQPPAIAVLTGAKAIPCPMPREVPKAGGRPFGL
ncbi:MAG: ligase-associated DNA damage response endonuclease PdeM, partial [Paracoccaceae bacterium]